MSKDDYEEEWVAEALPAMQKLATGEFRALQRRLRRQAGLDLTRWEKVYRWVLALVGIRVTFK